MNNGGDVLARGGKMARFGGYKVSQDKWDAIFADRGQFEGVCLEADVLDEHEQALGLLRLDGDTLTIEPVTTDGPATYAEQFAVNGD